MRKLFLFLTCAVLALAAENRPADEKAVRAAVDQFNEAAHKGDQAALEKLLDADLIYGHSSAKIENKAECIGALVKGKPNFVPDPGSTVQLYGGTAVVHGRMTAHNMQGGKATQIPLDFIQVWVKHGKDWRMVTRHTARVQ